MNQIQHGELIIKRAWAFFDSWLERFTTWDDFVQGVRNNPLPEFRGDRETAIQQVTTWLGGQSSSGGGPFFIREQWEYCGGEGRRHPWTWLF